jgi:predicted Zn-dependent peptidase
MRHEAKKHVYPNGLTLIVDEAHQLKSVAIGAWVKTGSRHESVDASGMCHFLEHMIFKGSEKRGASDISKAVDRVGGDFNAFTSREHTCFHFYLPYQEIELGAELLQEILFKPLFEKKEIEKERQVILQEIAMTKENPEEDSFDRFLEKAYANHPLGRNILGTKKSVESVNRARLMAFFHEHYRPESMVLAVSGAVGFDKCKRIFSRLGGEAWPGRQTNRPLKPNWGASPPGSTHPGFWWIDEAAEQAHVLYGISAPVSNQKERVISTMIQQHLGGGMSSVLFDRIREKKGWAYSVYASAIQFLDSSVFSIYAGVKPDKVAETLAVFHQEMQKTAREGIPLVDLKRIQDSLVYSFELSLESSESRMMTISSSELFFKRGFTYKAYEDLIRSIRPGETRELAQSWVKNSSPTILVQSPWPKNREARQAIRACALKLTGLPPEIETP